VQQQDFDEQIFAQGRMPTLRIGCCKNLHR